ncbi:MAG: hypothetical protein WB586_07845 [Chthoniobacterales bacterium]
MTAKRIANNRPLLLMFVCSSSMAGFVADVDEILDLAYSRRPSASYGLDEIARAYDRVEQGQVRFRAVITT